MVISKGINYFVSFVDLKSQLRSVGECYEFNNKNNDKKIT